METSIKLVPELVRKQLKNILEGEDFKRTPLLARFLEFVVDKKLSEKEDEIKEYTVGVFGLGRSPDFNPQIDASVRIHASRLRGLLFKYYNEAGTEDVIIISIPRGGYVPSFEINRGQVAKLSHHVREQIETAVCGKPDISREVSTKPVLAVLPFHDFSTEHSNNEFLESLAEQLTTELSKFDNLSILSNYVTSGLTAGVNELKNLSNKEKIDYILTGSLTLINNMLRLSFQLMIVDRGNILWSDHFQSKEFTNQNIFKIQDEITGKIANIIADDHGIVGTLNKLRPFRHFEKMPLLQDALSQYFDYTYNNDPKKFKPTLAVVENACNHTENNALIVSILSKLYLIRYAFSIREDTEVFKKGMELATKSLRFDPRCQHAQKAFTFGLILSGNREKSLEGITRCIAINPMAASNLRTMALGFILLGEYENGYSTLIQSNQLNPNQSSFSRLGFALYYFQKKNYEEAARWLHRLSPFDTPFSELLLVAVQGKTNGKIPVLEPSVLKLKGHERKIVERLIHDQKLVGEILEGWALAGLEWREIDN